MTITQNQWEALVPTTKHDAVRKALASIFGTTKITEAALLAGGGSSALVLRIVVSDEPFVLRVIPQIHELNDPARQFTCLTLAADAGISPPVYYTDAADAVSITGFVQTVPFREYAGSPLVALAETVKAIHALPLFPPFVNYLDGLDGFIAQFQSLGILPEHATREHFDHFAQLRAVYPRHDPDLVSSHNDLNPRNILFDGNKLWVIDWEAAFRNDRYADLANIANFFFRDEPDSGEAGREEEILLGTYFGDTLDEVKQARFYLMRPVVRMVYAMLLMLSVAGRAPDTTWDASMETPRLRDFHKRMADGASAGDPLASVEGQFLYAKVWLNEALHSMKTPRFSQSLRQLSK